ncbi:DNA binding domain-containing protein, excisionase family [Paraburkholderia phenazinium]|uniref:DNA binding domain-containing protein, excisionase family n=1 Tax=Paraburkholderia phenazinium TaxID=60549 RepID=A0A1G7Y9H2_9BURK|nr:helix-turn-helix domain-containing protein [Paraburkholderia phenazinium]SDG93024.1 DNA binding domain-containing protein, excisionase family [Paraburkholderia phenazinium]
MTTATSIPLTVKQAAQLLGLGEGRVLQLLRASRLTRSAAVERATNPGSPKHYVTAESVEALRVQRAATEDDPFEKERRRQNRQAEHQRQNALREALSQDMLTPSDVARELGVTRQAVHIGVNRGSLPTVQIGGRRLVRRADLEALKQKRASR